MNIEQLVTVLRDAQLANDRSETILAGQLAEIVVNGFCPKSLMSLWNAREANDLPRVVNFGHTEDGYWILSFQFKHVLPEMRWWDYNKPAAEHFMVQFQDAQWLVDLWNTVRATWLYEQSWYSESDRRRWSEVRPPEPGAYWMEEPANGYNTYDGVVGYWEYPGF